MTAIKTHFDGKVFVPDEPVNLKRGQVAIVHVPTEAACAPDQPTAPPQGQHLLDWVVQNLTHETERADGAAQHDHYIYGSPKRAS